MFVSPVSVSVVSPVVSEPHAPVEPFVRHIPATHARPLGHVSEPAHVTWQSSNDTE